MQLDSEEFHAWRLCAARWDPNIDPQQFAQMLDVYTAMVRENIRRQLEDEDHKRQ